MHFFCIFYTVCVSHTHFRLVTFHCYDTDTCILVTSCQQSQSCLTLAKMSGYHGNSSHQLSIQPTVGILFLPLRPHLFGHLCFPTIEIDEIHKFYVLYIFRHLEIIQLTLSKRHGQFVAFYFYCKIMLISISYNYCSTNKCFIEKELTSVC